MDANPYAMIGQALSAALGRLRDRHADMTLLQAQCLFHVASNPGVTQVALCRALDASDGTTSRTIAILSDIGGRNGSPGLDLVKLDNNPHDRREKYLSLTPRGKRLMDDLITDLKPVRR
jgi:DNA-binding MarR family transcriptional regulator